MQQTPPWKNMKAVNLPRIAIALWLGAFTLATLLAFWL